MGALARGCRAGTSHSPKELSRPEDIANGANALLQAVLRLDQDGLD
jgi:N-carbamoyl-L-amino-acid hydrolase